MAIEDPRILRLLIGLKRWVDQLSVCSAELGTMVNTTSWQAKFRGERGGELEHNFGVEQSARLAGGWISDEEIADRIFTYSYVMVSALTLMDGFAQKLAKEQIWCGELASKGNKFREEYRKSELKDLRDLMEHANEHIDEEKYQIASDFDSGPGVTFFGWPGAGFVEIVHFYGKDFSLYETFSAADSFGSAVQEIMPVEIPESMRRPRPDSFRS